MNTYIKRFAPLKVLNKSTTYEALPGDANGEHLEVTTTTCETSKTRSRDQVIGLFLCAACLLIGYLIGRSNDGKLTSSFGTVLTI